MQTWWHVQLSKDWPFTAARVQQDGVALGACISKVKELQQTMVVLNWM